MLLIIFLLAASLLEGSSGALELSPSNSLTVCPGDTVLIECSDSYTSELVLLWTVKMEGRDKIDLPFLSNIRNVSEMLHAPTGLTFHANLTSAFPQVSSTFTTTADLALHNAQVTCTVGRTMNRLMIFMKGIIL